MQYISSQPDSKYFHWQLEVQFLNFLEIGIPLEQYSVLIGFERTLSKGIIFLSKKYPQVDWHFYEDTRKNREYAPSIKPFLLKKYFQSRKDKPQTIFLIDSDVIFINSLKLDKLVSNKLNYMSDTESYLGKNYVNSKGNRIIRDLCRIVGVDIKLVEETPSGGAQYILKNTFSSFWEKVEKDSVKIYRYLRDNENTHKKESITENYVSIQRWCSEMWSLLYNLVLLDSKRNRVTSKLDFCWPTDKLTKIKPILHNAGVTDKLKEVLFYKGEFRDGLDFNLLEKREKTYSLDYCSVIYFDYIKRLKK